MFDDLIEAHKKLGNMLSDVQEQFADLHPDDVAAMLRNCELTAMELARDILARREYIHELAPYWKVTQSGSDAGMPPGRTLSVPGQEPPQVG